MIPKNTNFSNTPSDNKGSHSDALHFQWRIVHPAIWLIGLAFLFWWGDIFPGVLVLAAISGLAQAGMKAYANRAQETQMLATKREAQLPEICPNCGGPLHASSVRWKGKQSASCPYCGSTIKLIEA